MGDPTLAARLRGLGVDRQSAEGASEVASLLGEVREPSVLLIAVQCQGPAVAATSLLGARGRREEASAAPAVRLTRT